MKRLLVILFRFCYVVGLYESKNIHHMILALLVSQGLIYLKWFQYVSFAIISLGIIAGTIQIVIRTNKEHVVKKVINISLVIIEILVSLVLIFIMVVFTDKESIVDKHGITMVKEKNSFSSESPTNFYDYQNIFVRKNIVRIRIEYGNMIHGRTTYYDENGEFIRASDGVDS